MKLSVKNIETVSKNRSDLLKKLTKKDYKISDFNYIQFDIYNAHLMANYIRTIALDDITNNAFSVEEAEIVSTDPKHGPWTLKTIPFVEISNEIPVGTKFYINFQYDSKALKPAPILSNYLLSKTGDYTKHIKQNVILGHIAPGARITAKNISVTSGTGRENACFHRARIIKFRELDYTYVYYLNERGFVEVSRKRVAVVDLIKLFPKMTTEDALTKKILIEHPKARNIGAVDKRYIETMDFRTDKDIKFYAASEVNPKDYRIKIHTKEPKKYIKRVIEVIKKRFLYARDNYMMKEDSSVSNFKILGENTAGAHVICWYIFNQDPTISLVKFDDNYNASEPAMTINVIHPNAKKIYEKALDAIIEDVKVLEKSF